MSGKGYIIDSGKGYIIKSEADVIINKLCCYVQINSVAK